jgi:hypothetical protein
VTLWELLHMDGIKSCPKLTIDMKSDFKLSSYFGNSVLTRRCVSRQNSNDEISSVILFGDIRTCSM